MIKLARIYYTDELVNHEPLEHIDYVKGDDLIDLNFNLPTLIVGWLSVRKLINNSEETEHYKYLHGASILDSKILSNTLYWAYSFKEDKHGHISKVEEFVYHAPEYYFNGRYTYINLDPVFFSIESVEELMNLLPKTNVMDLLTLKRVYTYIYKNDMIYILCDNKITGIDLKIYDYFNFDIEKIKVELLKRSFQYIDDIDGSKYQSYYKKLPNFDNLKRYMPVFLSNE
jgi:hypothetical protein